MIPADLTDLAAAIADGRPIDWSELAPPPSCPDVVLSARIVERIAQAHASVPSVDSFGSSLHRSLAGVSLPGDETAPPETPVMWGTLAIVEQIGRGTFGDVYRAHDQRLNRMVALKLLRRKDRRESAVIEEGHVMARVRHPNVVTVYGAERIDGRVGMWMQFVDGPTLEDELKRRGPFTAAEITDVGVQLAQALDAVHRAGLLHRDVTARNAMRDADGRVLLTDFGTGREVSEANGAGAGPELAGTPLYLAPEVLDGAPASVASDVYGLGVLLYRLACGSFPVYAHSLDALREAHRRAGPIPLTSVRPQFPRALAAVIERALEPDVQRRIATARQLESQLRTAVSPGRARTMIALSALTTITVASVWSIAIRTPTAPLPASTSVTLSQLDAGFQEQVNIRHPSADSRFVTCTPWGHGSVAICDLATKTVREVRVPSSRRERCSNAFLAPDLKHIAYVWNDGPASSVRLIGSDGSADRELASPRPGDSLNILQWIRGGTAIVLVDIDARDRKRLLIVPLDGSNSRELRTFTPEEGQIFYMQLSPDERYLVMERRGTGKDDERKVIIVDVQTGDERAFSGNWDDFGPRWTPDGRSIVFGSNRFGTRALFSVEISNGRPVGEPRLVRDLGRSAVTPMDFSRDGTLFLRAMVNWLDVFRAPIDLDGASIGPLTRVDSRSIDENVGPDWSPDDERFAYLSGEIGYVNGRTRVEVHHRDGLAERLIALPSVVPKGGRVRWSPDGKQLAVVWAEAGSDPAIQSIYLIDLQSNAMRALATDRIIWELKWDPRGTHIYYGAGGSIRRVDVDTRESVILYQGSPDGQVATDSTNFDISPDGTSIAFIGRSRSGRGIRLLSLADRGVTERYNFSGESRAVAWSRDGRRLLVSASRTPTSRPSIFVMDVAGGEPRSLNVQTEYIVDFSLRHDDRELLLATGNPHSDVWMLGGLGR